MLTDSVFHWARLRAAGRNAQALADHLRNETLPRCEAEGGTPWMLSMGLFGLWSNELLLATRWQGGAPPTATLARHLPPGGHVVTEYELLATLRPLTTQPPARPGIYVHRLFEVRAADIGRFVALSAEAWDTFEHVAEYAAEPQGLFHEREHAEDGGMMLLVTWYDTLQSWESSRTPAPGAAANFRARANITRRSMAFATRLA